MSFGFQNALFLKEIFANLMMKFITVCQTFSPFQGVNSSLYVVYDECVSTALLDQCAGYVWVLYSATV